MKYLDLVELIRERPAYTKAGVKVGDFGAIMSEKAVDGKCAFLIKLCAFKLPKTIKN